jgi:hypothetical protein
MDSPALLKPGTGVGKCDRFGQLRELPNARGRFDFAEKLGPFGSLSYNIQIDLHCC